MIFHAERLYSSEEFIYKDRSFVCLAFNSGPMESSGMVLDNRVSGWLEEKIKRPSMVCIRWVCRDIIDAIASAFFFSCIERVLFKVFLTGGQ